MVMVACLMRLPNEALSLLMVKVYRLFLAAKCRKNQALSHHDRRVVASNTPGSV